MDKTYKKDEFPYDYMVSLGFKKIELSDSIFENQYGHTCFLLTKKLTSTISINWDCRSHVVTMYREYDPNNPKIIVIETQKELEKYLEFFSRK